MKKENDSWATIPWRKSSKRESCYGDRVYGFAVLYMCVCVLFCVYGFAGCIMLYMCVLFCVYGFAGAPRAPPGPPSCFVMLGEHKAGRIKAGRIQRAALSLQNQKYWCFVFWYDPVYMPLIMALLFCICVRVCVCVCVDVIVMFACCGLCCCLSLVDHMFVFMSCSARAWVLGRRRSTVDFRNFIVFFGAETLAHWNPTSCQTNIHN